jgi:hypothetical protein
MMKYAKCVRHKESYFTHFNSCFFTLKYTVPKDLRLKCEKAYKIIIYKDLQIICNHLFHFCATFNNIHIVFYFYETPQTNDHVNQRVV